MKTLFALLLLVFAASAYSEDKAPEKAKAEPEKKSEAPVVEIKRTGPPPCNVKPVMTDEEIEVCKRAGYAPRQKPSAPELSR